MPEISPEDPHPRKRAKVLDSEMAYVEVGEGDPVIFLHGNPTSSYLWRNVIPHVQSGARCIAPDLIGMGESGPAKDGTYTLAEHITYMDAFLEEIGPLENVTFVLHDWGGAIGFDWARRHPHQIRALAYMETIVMPVKWDDWPENARGIFQGMRSEKGEELVLERNIFVEGILPNSILRDLSEEEHDRYRAPFQKPGEKRRPMLTWPRQIPIEGEPANVAEIVEAYGKWLGETETPKLFVNADPGSILTGRMREFCRSWPNQEEVTVKGLHFIQEDSPHEIGEAIAGFLQKH